MGSTPTSLHPLASFVVDPSDIEAAPRIQPTRNIGWVVKWAAALAVLLYATTVLTEFAYSLMAEQLLVRAARAGVLEATLPRATPLSVEQSVWRRLPNSAVSEGRVKLALLQNGSLVGKRLELIGGDRLSLTVAMRPHALMPGWLRALTSWRGEATVRALAERSVPGRKIVNSSTVPAR
jgi:hypothetical protein